MSNHMTWSALRGFMVYGISCDPAKLFNARAAPISVTSMLTYWVEWFEFNRLLGFASSCSSRGELRSDMELNAFIGDVLPVSAIILSIVSPSFEGYLPRSPAASSLVMSSRDVPTPQFPEVVVPDGSSLSLFRPLDGRRSRVDESPI